MTCAKYISCKLDFARHLNWGKPWEKLRTTWIMNTLGMLFSVTRYWFVYTMVLTFVLMKTSDKRRCTLCRWSRKFDLILLLDWFGQMTAITSTQFWNSDNEFHKVQIWDENGVESILNFMIYGRLPRSLCFLFSLFSLQTSVTVKNRGGAISNDRMVAPSHFGCKQRLLKLNHIRIP